MAAGGLYRHMHRRRVSSRYIREREEGSSGLVCGTGWLFVVLSGRWHEKEGVAVFLLGAAEAEGPSHWDVEGDVWW